MADVVTPGAHAPLEYRPSAGIMLVNATGGVFVGHRIDHPGEAWQMPQGGIDDGETPAQAAVRELLEETGISAAEIVAEDPLWLSYDLPPDLRATLWGGRYRGQRQKWFLMRFTGGEDDINIHTAHPEFDDWKWLPLEHLVAVAVPFKRDTYRHVVDLFTPMIRNWIA